jgi:hypothetical protein
MRKILYYLAIVVSTIIFSSCANNNEPTKKETKKNNEEVTSVDTTELIIHGKNIWIRDLPKTGNVVAKLNTGDTCQILAKGIKEQIKCDIDFWYEIQLGDTIGWVYGSQTNIALNEEPNVIEYEEMLKTYFELDSSLSNIIHPQLEYYFSDNPGASCIAYKNSYDRNIEFLQFNEYVFSNEFPKAEGYFNTDYPGTKDGIYYSEMKITDLPKLHTEPGGGYNDYYIPTNLKLQKIFYNMVIKNEGYCCTFYMALIDCSWL